MAFRVQVSRRHRCGACWEGIAEEPDEFRIERHVRGGEPVVVAAGEFPGWEQLRELARSVR